MNGNTGRKRGPAWTDEANDRLVALRAEGMEWPAIAVKFPGRTPEACAQQHAQIQRRLRRAASPDAAPATRRTRAEIVAETRQELPDPARLPRHDSITAALFGDPPPGRSALDQLRAQRA